MTKLLNVCFDFRMSHLTSCNAFGIFCQIREVHAKHGVLNKATIRGDHLESGVPWGAELVELDVCGQRGRGTDATAT